MTFGRVLNFESSRLIHVSKIGDDTMAGATLGSYGLHERPIVVSLTVPVEGNSLQKHAANILHDHRPAQGGEF